MPLDVANNYAINNHVTSSQESPSEGNQVKQQTVLGVSVVPQEEVASLLTLPDEILPNITRWLEWPDVKSLSLVNYQLSQAIGTKEKLKHLAHQYYGSNPEVHKEKIKNRVIPAVPNHEISDPLSRLVYHRHQSNRYLASLEKMTQEPCVATLNRDSPHTVKSCTLLSDGLLASGDDGGIIRVWDPTKPDGKECVAKLEGHSGAVVSLVALADGRFVSVSDNSYGLSYASRDGIIKVWDLTKPVGQQCVAMLRGHPTADSVMKLSNGLLVSTSRDGTIKVWDLTKPDPDQCVMTCQGASLITALPDGRLAFTSSDKTIRVLDPAKPDGEQCVAVLKGHEEWICSLTGLSDGRLASGSSEGVWVWDLTEPDGKQCVAKMKVPNEPDELVHKQLIELADGRLTSVTRDTIRLWDLTKPDGEQYVMKLWKWLRENLRSVKQLSDGRLIATCEDYTIRVWDPARSDGGKCLAIFGGFTHVPSVTELADGQVVVWDDYNNNILEVWRLTKPCTLSPPT